MGLRFAPEVQDFVRTLAPGPKNAIRQATEKVRKDPRHDGLDVKVLVKEGPIRFFRARVGAYRIIYSVLSDHTYIWRIQHRSEGYAWLERLDPDPRPS